MDPEFWWALELISCSYCLKFQGKALQNPGVKLCPLGDPPCPPPGAVFNFYQRKGKHCDHECMDLDFDLDFGRDTPELQLPLKRPRKCAATFASSHEEMRFRPRVADAARADGCIGLLTVKVPTLAADPVLFFVRVAYGSGAGQSALETAHRVTKASLAALRANPFFLRVQPEVQVCQVAGGSPMDQCPRILWDQAPVPPTEMVTVVLLKVGVGKQEGCSPSAWGQQALSDSLTRFMQDMMLEDPELAVVPQASHVALALFTNKTPGLMNVRSAMLGVPISCKPGAETRPIRDVHPGCAIKTIDIYPGTPSRPTLAPVRDLPVEELAALPLFEKLLTPTGSPFNLRGFEVSVYNPSTGATLMAGTRHSWVCLGALTYDRIMRPHHPDHNPLGLFPAEVPEARRRACFELLHPALYNVTALETFWSNGCWSKKDATRRAFWRPYALDNTLLTAAVFWVFGYPGFVEDWTRARHHVPPTGTMLDVWHIKTYSKAYLEFAARYGRIVRMLLNNRVRNIRRDYSDFVLGTYFCATKDPARPMRLVDTFRDCIVLGKSRPKEDTAAAVKKEEAK
jgi:hypothetical protein